MVHFIGRRRCGPFGYIDRDAVCGSDQRRERKGYMGRAVNDATHGTAARRVEALGRARRVTSILGRLCLADVDPRGNLWSTGRRNYASMDRGNGADHVVRRSDWPFVFCNNTANVAK